MISRTTWTRDIAAAAALQRLDADVVEALVIVESFGNPYAYKPEPSYRYLWDLRTNTPFRALTDVERSSERAPSDFATLAGSREQEFWAQQASWGLMQLMGAVARELGFRGLYLTELTRVELNLTLGCKLLAQLMRWAAGDTAKALAAYNAGRGGWAGPQGQAYQHKVSATLAQLERRT